MKIFGKRLEAGAFRGDAGACRVEGKVDRIPGGWKATGTVRGRAGRVEILRAPAPHSFLMNNWQSWGPMQPATPETRFPELQKIFSSYSPWIFSPVPETLGRTLVSDYFLCGERILIGFLASRIAHPFFAIEGGEIAGYLEYFDTAFEDPVPLEPLVILEGETPEDLLEKYGFLIRRENRVKTNSWNPVGWCSWYHYFGKLAWADVIKNLDIARREKGFPFEVFQVDDGYETEVGDWMTPKSGYPDLGGLAGEIQRRKFAAGIWTAPFSAAETSELFGRHPGWMVAEGGSPKPSYKGWGRTIHALDTTSPEVKAWLFDLFSALGKAGFSYLKIDFLFAAAMPGARRKNVTPIQAYREGLRTIRKAAGDSFILGCGAPLLPSAGLVDGMRIGEDTAPCWKSKPSPFEGPNAYFALKNALFRQFMHRKLWLNDPDCLLLRSRELELSLCERELYALAAGALDNMIVVSDDLALINSDGKDLLRRALGLKGGQSRVLGLFGDDAYVIESKGGPAGKVRLAVNLSDSERILEGADLAPRSTIVLAAGDL